MEKDYVIPPDTKIKQAGIFDIKELYLLMYYWFQRNNYANFHEREYLEKIGAGGKEIDIKWYADRKINDYIKFVIEVSFLILGFQEVEVERNGKKVKTGSGNIEMKFRSYLLKDYEDVWEKRPLMKFLRQVYDKYIIGSKIEQYEDDLYEETYMLMNEIKAFLNLHRF